ncbi:AAA family ATPase [Pasteurellaceae bacterium 22721_9_1]
MSLVEQIKQIMVQTDISQAQIAKEIGYTSAVLSSYCNGRYKGDVQGVERAIENWLKSREQKQKIFVDAPHFIETETAKKVWSALDMARLLNTMVTIYGASGVGKTKASQEYAKTYSNVWMITASPARATLSSILYELALELGVNDAPRRKDKLSRVICKKLKGTQGLVIIDESDHLPYDALEEIRIIQEECEVGIALIGNDKVYTRIQGGINQAHEYARLWSRVGRHFPFKRTLKNDIKAIAKAWGLDNSDKGLMDVLFDIGGKSGGLRSLTQCLRLAAISAKGQGSHLNLELILNALADLKGEAK